MMQLRTYAAAVLATVLIAGWAGAESGIKSADGRGQVILSWEEFIKITGYDPAKGGAQTLSIPWSEVEDLIGVKVEKVGAATTVDLPWGEFKELLQWSVRRQDKDTAPPPTDYLISSSQYTGALGAESADFTLKAKVEVLREKGWKRIPLLPTTVALTKTTLPDGVYLNATDRAYEVLTQATGSLELSLEFSVAVKESAGINQLSFARVAPGSSVLDLTIAREEVDVKVADSQSIVAKSEAGKTQVAAAIPSRAAVSVSWERALPKVEAAPPKLYAETRTLVAVAEGMLLCQETVNFNILHAAVRELKLAVPADTSVLEVNGQSVQDWRLDDQGALSVVLRNEVIGSYSLRLTFERAGGDGVEAPVVRASGVEREKGFVGVVAMTNVEIAAGEVQGAAAIDVRQLPPDIIAMTNQPILLAFRYVGEEFAIPLSIKKHGEVEILVTIIDRALFTGMQLSDGRRMTKVLYSVRNNRNQFLRLEMPAEAEIWSVEVNGNTVSPAKDEDGKVLLPLVRSARGTSELSSFPVEMVYVETPDATAPERGKLHVDLPRSDAPLMHVMYNYYLPPEGTYKARSGRGGFTGPMRLVKDFTSLTAGPGAQVVHANAAGQVAAMQQQVDVQVDQRARAAGATPIRVRLPINGKLFRLEKILALPKDELWFEAEYSGWKAPE